MADKFHGDFPVRVPSVGAASAGSADAVRLWGSCSDLEIKTVADLLHNEVDDTLESRLAEVKLKLRFEAEQLFNSDVVDAFPFFDKAVEKKPWNANFLRRPGAPLRGRLAERVCRFAHSMNVCARAACSSKGSSCAGVTVASHACMRRRTRTPSDSRRPKNAQI